MADQLEITTAGGSVAAEAPQPGAAVPANQPESSGSGDLRLQGILQKQAAGQSLTASERGYLGSVKRKGKAKAMPATPADNPLLQAQAPAPAVADNPLFEATQPAGGLADSPAPVPVDSALIRSAAGAILDSLDTATKLFIGHEAKKGGADESTIAAYKSAVALQPENRELMVSNSEPLIMTLCNVFHTTPENLAGVLKNCGFIGGLAAHSLAVYSVAKSIRESRAEKTAQTPAPAP